MQRKLRSIFHSYMRDHETCIRSLQESRFCVFSFTSDWLFPTEGNREIVHALNAVAANVSFVEIESDKGHDAFLLDEPEFFRVLGGFIDGAAELRGLPRR